MPDGAVVIERLDRVAWVVRFGASTSPHCGNKRIDSFLGEGRQMADGRGEILVRGLGCGLPSCDDRGLHRRWRGVYFSVCVVIDLIQASGQTAT
jgi:hypothetical protein